MPPNAEQLTSTIVLAIAEQGLAPDRPPGATIGRHSRRALAEPAITETVQLVQALPQTSLSDGVTSPHPNYRVVSTLGEGGMGHVLLAEQRSLQRQVAVKVVREDRRDDVALASLLNEAALCGALEHPNIVPVYDFCQTPADGPLIVMRRLIGHPWDVLLKAADHVGWAGHRGTLLERNLAILLQICRAVEFAHSRHVIHRDIKPENVIVGAYGEVYLVDWGVARHLDAPIEDDGVVLGTPAYMSPEQAVGATDCIGPATDVYLLGATLHEVVTGEVRHAGASIQRVLVAAAVGAPFSYGEDVPAELAAICNKACALQPGDRFAGVAAFREALGDFLDRRASIDVAHAAERRFEALRPMLRAPSAIGDPAQDRGFQRFGVLIECRFAFQQALETWPANPVARAGLQRCLEAMITYQLDGGDYRTARELLAQLPEPRKALERRVAEVRRTRHEEGAAQASLVELKDRQRFAGLDKYRSAVAMGTGIVWATMLLLVSALMRLDLFTMTPAINLSLAVGTLALVTGLSLSLRHRLVYNELFKNFIVVVCFIPLAGVVNRVLAMALGLPFYEVLLIDFVIMFTVVGVCAATVERRLWWDAAAFGGALGLSVAVPSVAMEAAAVSALALGLHMSWLLRPDRAGE